MSASALCRWSAADPTASLITSRWEVKQKQVHTKRKQSLIPIVGLVKESRFLHVRSSRWHQSLVKEVPADLRQKWRAQSSKSMKASSVDEKQFEAEVLQSSIPVLVDFWAPWCGPCRLMGITLDWAAQEYAGKIKCVKIETDSNQGLVDKYKVYGLPTLILFVNGEIVPNTQREGAMNKEKLQIYLEKNLPTLAATT